MAGAATRANGIGAKPLNVQTSFFQVMVPFHCSSLVLAGRSDT